MNAVESHVSRTLQGRSFRRYDYVMANVTEQGKDSLSFGNNVAESRYEALLNGEVLGVIEYSVADSEISLLHTGTEPQARGKGIASQLVEWTLNDIRSEGAYKVRPYCGFIRAYLRDNPGEYDGILA